MKPPSKKMTFTVGALALLLVCSGVWYRLTRCAAEGCNRPHTSSSVYCAIHETAFASRTAVEEELDSYETQSDAESISASDINATSASPLECENALDKAIRYLDLAHFSADGLKGQLEYDGFSSDAADYAIARCGADWYKQAAGKAQDYLDLTSFSRSGLIGQLEYDGFTHDQAVYGAEAVGY